MKIWSHVILLFWFLIACSRPQADNLQEHEGQGGGLIIPIVPAIGNAGTAPPSIPLEGRIIPADSTLPPVVNKAKTPKVKPAHSNIIKAGPPAVIPVNTAALQRITPGLGGVPMPEVVEFQVEQRPASHPVPSAAAPFALKDRATVDLRYLDTDQGLNTSLQLITCEDSRGYLWFSGYYGGLCRYDGYQFLTYLPKHGLPGETVTWILEDQDKNLWLGIRDWGISKFDGQTFTNYRCALPDVGTRMTWTLFQDSKGILWIGTEHGGLFRFDGRQFLRFTTVNGLLHNYINSITEDKQGRLWIATPKGLSCYDGQTITNYQKEDGLPAEEATFLEWDLEEKLWIGTTDGISKFDGQSFTNYTKEQGLSNDFVWAIREDDRGHIWIGTRRGGLNGFDGTNFIHYGELEGLSNNEVLYIFEDSQDQLWISTYGGGVNKFNVNAFQHLILGEDLDQNVVNDIFEDSKGNLWFATERGGAIKYDGQNLYYYTSEEGLPSNEIAGIVEDKEGNLWFATIQNGIAKFDGSSFTYFSKDQGLLLSYIIDIKTDSLGRIWIASDENGLSSYDGTGFQHYSEETGLNSEVFYTLSTSVKGDLWITGTGGAGRYDGRSMELFSAANGLLSSEVFDVLEDSKGDLWFATIEGLCRYDGKNFNTFKGLDQQPVKSLFEDHRNNLWVGTERGIFLLERVPSFMPEGGKEAFRLTDFSKEDGLKGENIRRCNFFLDSDKRLWFGTKRGLANLDLEQFYTNRKRYIPFVNLHNVKINEQNLDFVTAAVTQMKIKSVDLEGITPFSNLPKNLSVPFKSNHFTFEFAAFDWAAPHKIEYQYQLEGLESKWSQPTNSPSADYRSIPFGTYTFKVRARSDAQIWSQPVAYRFTILPPWWHSWWAYMCYLVLVIVASRIVYLLMKRRWILKNQLLQQEREAQRLKELNNFKSRLYTNLTHEFRTPLTVILGMTDQIAEKPQRYLEEGLQLIRRNGSQLLRLINQLLDLSKLENKALKLQLQLGDIVSYLRYLTESYQTYANSKNLSLQFFTPFEELIMDYDPEQIKQIMTNLISNAIKFTPSAGTIRVRLNQEKDRLLIEVADTGIGIPEKDLPHIFDRFYQVDGSTTRQGEGTGIGLAHTKELIRLMNGKIQVESEMHKGTCFRIVLPIRQTAEPPQSNQKQSEQNDEHLTYLPPQSQEVKTKKTAPAGRLPQLLIMEDNPDVVNYLTVCLEDHYKLDIALNGMIGIQKALDTIPDLIISDVMMPVKDGFEVCNTLKNDERTSHIPIILLTAKADLASRISGLKTGADAYLAKPFNKVELMVRIDMMVRKQQQLTTYFAKKFQKGAITIATPLSEEDHSHPLEHAFIQKVHAIVEEHYAEESFSLPELCRRLGMSRSQLFRKMKALIDVSPSKYIRTYRLEKARVLLETTNQNVSEVAWQTGYKDIAHFSKSFSEEFGVPPSEWNAKA